MEQENRVRMERIAADPQSGLSAEQVKRRFAQGENNYKVESSTLSVPEIVRSNVCTYFNLVFAVIAVLLAIVGAWSDMLFLPIIVANTCIGIIQEVHSKKVLDKLSILNAPHAIVVRDGSQKQVASEELVEDDVILLRAGDQICGDASVLSGEVMVNESLLTGESDEINKTQGDELLSGSFVVSGQCHARLTHVGMDSYISKLSLEAKSMERTEQSEMIRSINQLVKWVGIAIIPIGIVLFSQSYFFNGETIARSVTATVAAVIGMIPEGLYLLATIALALGTIRLATKKVLLHDMKSIETLSRVDVLCVDKTGTITEPGMQVSHILWRRQVMEENGAEGDKGLWDREALQGMLADYVYASTDNNATMDALRAALDKMPEAKAGRRRPSHIQAFSSANKYGSMTFSDGTYFLGAPEFIMKDSYDAIAEEIASYVQKGYRLLLFAKQPCHEAPAPEVGQAGSGRHFTTGLCDLIQSDPCQCKGDFFLF